MKTLVMLACSVFLVLPAVAQGRTTVDTAVAAYNEHRYREALIQFERLDRTERSDKIQYYLGCCCQHLNQIARAQLHFYYVFRHAKDARLKYMARVAYMQVSNYATHRAYEGNGNYFQ